MPWQQLSCNWTLADFFHTEPSLKSHSLHFIFCGFSYHLEMLEQGEHKSPTGRDVPTEGLRSEFQEAWCWYCLNHTVHRMDSHHSQSGLYCSGEPVKSQTKLWQFSSDKTLLPTCYSKDRENLSRYLYDTANRMVDEFKISICPTYWPSKWVRKLASFSMMKVNYLKPYC